MIDNSCSETVELFVSCRNLRDADIFSKSDPFVNLYFARNASVAQPQLIGRTETMSNNLNPDFVRTFRVEYIFETKQALRFDVLDDDGGQQCDFLGSVETTLATVMGSNNRMCILDLKAENRPAGKLVVRWEKLGASRGSSDHSEHGRFRFRGTKLMNTDSFFDFWDKSDPYLKLMKAREDGTFLEVGRTEVVRESLEPVWQPIEVDLDRLLGSNAAFRVECWDWEEDGRDQFIGWAHLQAQQLASLPATLPLNNPKEKKPGLLVVESFERIVIPRFTDYLAGGLNLSVIVAIDFTGSNGVPTSPASLHYLHPTQPNQYQLALKAILEILLEYDSDKSIPVFGFGANPRFGGVKGPVSHCFNLSGRPGTSEARGFEELMQMYSNALRNVELSGPTLFAPLLEQAMKLAAACKQSGPNSYLILLILTDGEIHDMQKTIDILCACSGLPLSVIIVGVGNSEFDNMVKLDGDSGLFDSQGRKASRDIVQFTPFRNFNFDRNLLAKELLAELPGQVVQYMRSIGQMPAPPLVAQVPSASNKADLIAEGIFQVLNP